MTKDDLCTFANSDHCPESVRVGVEALLIFLTEQHIDTHVDSYISDHLNQQLTLTLTLDFK